MAATGAASAGRPASMIAEADNDVASTRLTRVQ
jgi:hypothetical protein